MSEFIFDVCGAGTSGEEHYDCTKEVTNAFSRVAFLEAKIRDLKLENEILNMQVRSLTDASEHFYAESVVACDEYNGGGSVDQTSTESRT